MAAIDPFLFVLKFFRGKKTEQDPQPGEKPETLGRFRRRRKGGVVRLAIGAKKSIAPDRVVEAGEASWGEGKKIGKKVRKEKMNTKTEILACAALAHVVEKGKADQE